jgi:tubulin monoglycylase TTLL3/8
MSRSVHLTNEAIQIKYDDFGKHEAGNKVSYEEFQHYIETHYEGIKPPITLRKHILPKIKVHCIYMVEHNNGYSKISV